MTAFDTLTLELVEHPRSVTPQEMVGQQLSPGPLERTVCGAWARVNGGPLFSRESVSDVLAVLFNAANTGELTLLSCSCGVPECAGFIEPVQVRVEPAQCAGGWAVRWDVPVVGYARCMCKARGEGPWSFRFEREQVLDELARLSEALAQAHKRTTGGLYLSPCEPFCEFEKPLVRLPRILEQAQKHRQSWYAA